MRKITTSTFFVGFILLILFITPSQNLFADISYASTAAGGNASLGYKGATYTYPGSNNLQLQGHVLFKNGVTIPSSSTFLYDGDGLFQGNITFNTNSSSLLLSSDLTLGSTGRIVARTATGDWNQFYDIYASSRKIMLGGNLDFGDSSTQTEIFVRSGANLTIDGRGKTLSLRKDSSINLQSGSSLTLKNMTLVFESTGTGTGHINTASSNNSLILENVIVRAKNTGTAVTGIVGSCAVTIRGMVRYEAPGATITLKSGAGPSTITIDKNSTLYIGQNTKFRLQELANRVSGITMTDQTSTLYLNGCDFYLGPTNTSGLTITKGTVIFDNKVRIFNCDIGSETTPNSNMAQGLILGDGTAANDVNVRVLAAAHVIVDGCMQYNHS